jgi:hypothetical protein
LIVTGVGRGISEMQPIYMTLIWKNEKIYIEGYDKAENHLIYWNIINIRLPSTVRASKKEIYELIKEALMVHGVYGEAKVVITNFPELKEDKR